MGRDRKTKFSSLTHWLPSSRAHSCWGFEGFVEGSPVVNARLDMLACRKVI